MTNEEKELSQKNDELRIQMRCLPWTPENMPQIKAIDAEIWANWKRIFELRDKATV